MFQGLFGSSSANRSVSIIRQEELARFCLLIGFLLTVLSLSIWIGFSWGCLYGLVEAIPLVYSNVYGWRIGAVGLAFISVVIGAFLGWGLNRFQEKAYKKYR